MLEAEEPLQSILIPNIDIFKEIMVELIKSKEINLAALRKEKSEYIVEETLEFQLQDMILNVVENDEKKKEISKIYVLRTQDKKSVEFTNVPDESGACKTIRCSNVEIMVET